jgi:hypothetical protein
MADPTIDKSKTYFGANQTYKYHKIVSDILAQVGESVTPDITTVTKINEDTSGNITSAKGTTVPTDAETGYAKGCFFTDTDVANGIHSLYVNIGDETSCQFDLVGVVDTNAEIGEGYVQIATVSLTTSQIKNLAATPIQIVGAPGVGKVIEFDSATLRLNAGSEVLTEAGDNLGFKYTNGSGVQVSETVETTGFIDQASATLTRAVAKKDAIVALTGAENKALVLHNLNAEFAGNVSNDANLDIHITYRVKTV